MNDDATLLDTMFSFQASAGWPGLVWPWISEVVLMQLCCAQQQSSLSKSRQSSPVHSSPPVVEEGKKEGAKDQKEARRPGDNKSDI